MADSDSDETESQELKKGEKRTQEDSDQESDDDSSSEADTDASDESFDENMVRIYHLDLSDLHCLVRFACMKLEKKHVFFCRRLRSSRFYMYAHVFTFSTIHNRK